MEPPVQKTNPGPNVYFEGLPRGRMAAIPRLSTRILNRAGPARTPEDGSSEFMKALFGKAGLDISGYRNAALARREAACLRGLGARNAAEGLEILRRFPERIPSAIDSVLLGVTGFFRDGPIFSYLKSGLIPLLRERRGERLRVWSAACSTGQELYSVAMMLEEAGLLDRCELVGTDFRPEALALAKAGVFHGAHFGKTKQAEFPENPGPGPVWKMPATLAGRVEWRCRDLLTEMEAGPWDVILWRNMGIYLVPAAAHALWLRLAAELRPGGFLITGKAEQAPADCGLHRLAPSVYQKPGPLSQSIYAA
ncbi:MAG: methyltransferase, CheR-type [Verrucomicrobiales bacterium]|nr:methyltransferase, CheR-type [Verrucomicrobiales bacterium]